MFFQRLMNNMFTTAVFFLLLAVSSAAKEEQCMGGAPMENISSFLGMTLEYDLADFICCNNHVWAEDKGYLEWPEVDLFSRLDPSEEIIFYDSVCGQPLFVAPRGRSFDHFKAESIKHGWPSFRPEEMISENVILHDDGRMESICGTHLGHNLPEGGVDRYCIDLVCIAGSPASGLDFNATTYLSSAEQWSGKTKSNKVVSIVIAAVILVILGVIGCFVKKRCYPYAPKEKETTNVESDDVEYSQGKDRNTDSSSASSEGEEKEQN
mmetsp:Transcript_1056/g.1333  ORF Transcript_1056/g.1333 Transcript_1056/m.1333 type:complete len:266 (+) Transcript_1056:25-822(+)